jgi:hypothetical protein
MIINTKKWFGTIHNRINAMCAKVFGKLNLWAFGNDYYLVFHVFSD